MSQSKGFDMSKIATSEKLVGGAALGYLIWVFIPTWYTCCDVEGFGAVANEGVNGFRGFMILAWLVALATVAEIALKNFGTMNMKLPMARSQLHLIGGGIAVACTILGLLIKPSAFTASASLSWGIFVGLIIAAVWAYGAFSMKGETDGASSSPMDLGGPPPAPPAP